MRMRDIMNIVETKGVHMSPYTGHGPLYHGTDLIALAYIIQSDYLNRSIDTDNPAGVSLTFNKKMASMFADRSSFIFQDNHFDHMMRMHPEWKLGAPLMTGVVLELDSNKLRQSYKMINYEDGDVDDEDEVRVLTETIKPLSAYLTGIYLAPEDMAWYAEFLRSGYAKEDHTQGDQTAEFLLALAKHPLLRGPH